MALHCGDIRTDLDGLLGRPRSGRVGRIPVMSFAVDTGDGVLVFDTGCSPACCGGSPDAHLGPLARVFEVEMTPDATVAARIGQAGYGADDVRWVVNSHLHFDHAGMNGAFPAATHHVRARELAWARARGIRGGYVPADVPEWTDTGWDYDGTFDLLGDGSLVLTDTAGHTPGHQALVVSFADGRSFAAIGDAAYTAAAVDTGTPEGYPWDAERARRALVEIGVWRAAGTTVLTAHDGAQWAATPEGAVLHSA